MAGITPDGFTRKTYTQIQSEMQAYLRAKISKHLQLTEKTGLGNVVNSACDQLAEAWEALEAAYFAFDKDNAGDDAFVALCEITGTKRKGKQKGIVATTCNFSGAATFAPGTLIAHVDGFPANRWVNRDTVTPTGPGFLPVTFEAETAGAQGVALAGTLTRIAQQVSGWNSVTNSVDATPGKDIESLEDLYLRREQEMQASGSGKVASIRGAVSRVAGVIQVKSEENKTDVVSGILPPHSYRIIVWDGPSPAADNDKIAQAIYDRSSGAIPSIGSSSGVAIDEDGAQITIPFDRAVGIPIYVFVDVDGSEVGVAEAIVKEGSKLGVNSVVVREKLKAAVASLPGVADVTAFTLGFAPSPVGTANLTMAIDQIPLFDVSRITVD